MPLSLTSFLLTTSRNQWMPSLKTVKKLSKLKMRSVWDAGIISTEPGAGLREHGPL